jgi:hypothetical protein
VAAFFLTMITYAADYAWAPKDPRDPESVAVVFIFWFGIAMLANWLLSKRKAKPKGANE